MASVYLTKEAEKSETDLENERREVREARKKAILNYVEQFRESKIVSSYSVFGSTVAKLNRVIGINAPAYHCDKSGAEGLLVAGLLSSDTVSN